MQGWRITMEDAKITYLSDSFSLFGVFDGHGGHEVAQFVERHFVKSLEKNANFRRNDLERALTENFIGMDQLLLAPAGRDEIKRLMTAENAGAESMAGCTAIVVLIKDGNLVVANAGDSRAVLGRGGSAVELSEDHKPDLPTERERIIRAGGSIEDGRVMGNINLSRSLGDFEYKDVRRPPSEQMISAVPDTRCIPLKAEDDFVILACDGIWDMLTSEQAVAFVYERLGRRMPLTQIVEEMLDRCLAPSVAAHAGLGCDNMTCVIVSLLH
jgi:serine/threonine protein phosphatase PrpC